MKHAKEANKATVHRSYDGETDRGEDRRQLESVSDDSDRMKTREDAHSGR